MAGTSLADADPADARPVEPIQKDQSDTFGDIKLTDTDVQSDSCVISPSEAGNSTVIEGSKKKSGGARDSDAKGGYAYGRATMHGGSESGKESKDTALNNARKYQNEQVPKAEAEADRIRQNAEATKASRIAEAEGQAARFNTMFEQYQANPLITRQRLFFEAMEEILPGKKVIFTDGNTQELLPIDSFGSFSGTAGGETNE